MIKVVIIGSGNVAQHLLKVMLNTEEVTIVQVFARSKESISHLIVENQITSTYNDIKEADVYIISVSDNAIAEVASNLPFKNRLVVHTSGTSELSVLDNKNRKGVFYPLQTFSRSKAVDFSTIPICLETENERDYAILKALADLISKKAYAISSEQRKSLHVAAVFVCNFVNHLYQIGNEICNENKVPFEILQPLIIETANKITQLSPKEAQTGPALRNDTKTIEKHMDFLQESNYKELYKLLTQSIQNV
ncbi:MULTISPECIES: Rossmann-like and DUF2520 domain-containing protein [Flavobacterium]|uniref:Rossmann-like and DUF2520 domain-containing protein n=1 Tax=Flavobacterium jumunjinense TaxID=998845 RepID=A0ABV5GNS6_9FLAO|nr:MULTISPECIES: DUF2520 domain-containing protein [Flavobacterium]